jgi:hypothetical protein
MFNFLFAPVLTLFGADVDAFLFFAAAAFPAFVQVVSAVGLCTGWFVMMNSLSGSGPKAVETLDV